MTTKNALLLIPVENQVRELDAKLLLACLAAQRGFSSMIGSRREMEFNIDQFPRSIYLSKSMTIRSLIFFRVAKRFNHEIITWDEEALVHLPADTYFSRRLDPKAIRFVSHLFAWGQDNADLWRQYPHLPQNIPIHITGTPRNDMMRSQLRPFYEQEVNKIKNQYGDFLLLNTNFNHVNAYGADMNLFKPVKKPGDIPKFGRAARGMSRAYAEGLRDHKQAVLDHFLDIIPRLEKAFPDCNIVVRPHPTENHAIYKRIADKCKRVHVTNEGNVVPWIMATKAVLHNGCTTGVEAYMMGVPAVSYRATVNEEYDYGFYILPNKMSHQCFDFAQLKALLQQILRGELGAADGDERQALIGNYLASQEGPLACERMLDVLEQIDDDFRTAPRDSVKNKMERWIVTRGLHLAKGIKSSLPGSHNRPEFQRHRFPEISLEKLEAKLQRFQQLLDYNTGLKVEKVADVIFNISPHEVEDEQNNA
jgi:surface carbohydrate biosynthesis protein